MAHANFIADLHREFRASNISVRDCLQPGVATVYRWFTNIDSGVFLWDMEKNSALRHCFWLCGSLENFPGKNILKHSFLLVDILFSNIQNVYNEKSTVSNIIFGIFRIKHIEFSTFYLRISGILKTLCVEASDSKLR